MVESMKLVPKSSEIYGEMGLWLAMSLDADVRIEMIYK